MSNKIEVGNQVLLKKCAFTDRHKLEDLFHRDPFIVVGVSAEGDVYKIRPVLGGPEQNVNRKLLIQDPREP